MINRLAIFLLALCATRLVVAADVVNIGSQRELFVDYFLIDKLNGTELRMHRPVDEGRVLEFDKPWEGAFSGYVTIIHAGDKYQAYYRGSTGGTTKNTGDHQVTCYAESTDGIHWMKPDLDLYPRDGQPKSNIVLANAEPDVHNFAPFIDTRPDTIASEKYKAIGGYDSPGLSAYTSPDGIHWKRLSDKPVLTKDEVGIPTGGKSIVFDSQNVAFWSSLEKKYLLYYRVYKDGKRRIARVESDDFIHWKSPTLMEYRRRGDPPPIEQLYTNQTHPYFRAPHLYIATAARFMLGRQVLTAEQAKAIRVDPKYFHDTSDAVLMTSRGGSAYDRTFMEAFIAPGIGAENWVSRTNYPALNIVQTGPSEMSLYANQNYGQPSAHLRRYSLRLDGFASVHAGYDGGEMITKPFVFQGSRLYLNFATSAAGAIRVEVQDAEGKPVKGFALKDCREVIGNEIERSVIWSGGDLRQLAGTPVRLRFVMKDADLYALRFGEPSEAGKDNPTSPLSSEERQRLINVLIGALGRRDFVAVHAGDALATLGMPDPVLKAFEPQINSNERKYRIGIWRVLAQSQTGQMESAAHVARIRNVLLDESASDRLHALEALAKLDEPILDNAERRAVDHFTKDAAAAPFAWWRLVQAGQSSAVDQLIGCLRGDDVVGRTRAAYVLARFPSARGAARDALSAAQSKEPIDTTARVAIVCTLGGEPLRELAKNDSSTVARYSAAMELAGSGNGRDDVKLLKGLVEDNDEDVRVAAAFALLQIDSRARTNVSAASAAK